MPILFTLNDAKRQIKHLSDQIDQIKKSRILLREIGRTNINISQTEIAYGTGIFIREIEGFFSVYIVDSDFEGEIHDIPIFQWRALTAATAGVNLDDRAYSILVFAGKTNNKYFLGRGASDELFISSSRSFLDPMPVIVYYKVLGT